MTSEGCIILYKLPRFGFLSVKSIKYLSFTGAKREVFCLNGRFIVKQPENFL